MLEIMTGFRIQKQHHIWWNPTCKVSGRVRGDAPWRGGAKKKIFFGLLMELVRGQRVLMNKAFHMQVKNIWYTLTLFVDIFCAAEFWNFSHPFITDRAVRFTAISLPFRFYVDALYNVYSFQYLSVGSMTRSGYKFNYRRRTPMN